MSSVEEDVELVATFLGDALGGRFVVSFGSMKTLKAFGRLSKESKDHVVLGVCKWVKDDPNALDKLSAGIIKAYEKCSPEIRSEAAHVFSELAERIMSSD